MATLAHQVGKQLAGSFRMVEYVQEVFSDLKIKDSDIFLPAASLYLFAFFRASQVDSINIDSPTLKEVYDSLASFLVVKYLKQYGGSGDPDTLVNDLTSSVQPLIKTWCKNLDSEPSPHWYVAKEVWLRFQSYPDPAGIGLLSSGHSNSTIFFVEILGGIQDADLM